MGTNYYYREAPCPTCGRGDELHIGKSIYGWCFSLHVYPKRGINDLPDWLKVWEKPGSEIRDDYGATISPKELTDYITHRKRDDPPSMTDRELDLHFAVLGPNNLLRSKIDGTRCVAHGSGTWDLEVGDFS
jgi:hypothetical protein